MLKQNVPIEGITLKSKLTILRFLNSGYEMELSIVSLAFWFWKLSRKSQTRSSMDRFLVLSFMDRFWPDTDQ